jgi:hypothetical protein
VGSALSSISSEVFQGTDALTTTFGPLPVHGWFTLRRARPRRLPGSGRAEPVKREIQGEKPHSMNSTDLTETTNPTIVPVKWRKANRLSVFALFCAFIVPPLGIVFGTVALEEISASRETERGKGMARWAVGLGWLWLAALVVGVIVAIVLLTGDHHRACDWLTETASQNRACHLGK